MFRLVVDLCTDIDPNPETNCESPVSITQKLPSIYVDLTTISQFYEKDKGEINNTNPGQRIWLSSSMSNIVRHFIGALAIKKSTDTIKGTFLLSECTTIYQLFDYNFLTFQKNERPIE